MRVLIQRGFRNDWRRLTKSFAEQGHDILTLVRDPNPTARGFRGIPGLPSRIIPTWKVSMRWCTWPGQGLPIEDGPPPARISCGTVEVESTAHLRSALEERNAPPKRFLCASAIGWYGHRDNDILDESSSPGHGFLANLCARLGVIRSKQHDGKCLFAIWLSAGSIWSAKKCSPFFNLDSVVLWAPDATGKVGLVSMTRFVTSCISALPPLRTFAACTTWSRRAPFNNEILLQHLARH